MFISYCSGSFKYGVSNLIFLSSGSIAFTTGMTSLYILLHSSIFSSNIGKVVTDNILNVHMNVIGDLVVLIYVSKLFSHIFKSNPVRIYSARVPHVSILVHNLNCFILFCLISFVTVTPSFSTHSFLPPRLLFIFNSRCGNGSLSKDSRSDHVLLCINGSPPVIRRIFNVCFI